MSIAIRLQSNDVRTLADALQDGAVDLEISAEYDDGPFLSLVATSAEDGSEVFDYTIAESEIAVFFGAVAGVQEDWRAMMTRRADG